MGLFAVLSNTLKEKIDYTDAEILKCEKFINKYDRMILSFGMIYYDKGISNLLHLEDLRIPMPRARTVVWMSCLIGQVLGIGITKIMV